MEKREIDSNKKFLDARYGEIPASKNFFYFVLVCNAIGFKLLCADHAL